MGMQCKETDNVMDFWLRVDALRGSRLIKSICEESGVDYNKVMRNKCEKRLMPCMDTLKLARTLGVSMEYLLVGYETKPIKGLDQELVHAFQDADDVTKEMVYRVLNVPYEKNVKEEETSFIS